MRTEVWEVSCPGCGAGKIQIVQHPSRAEIEAMLPDSMRAPAPSAHAEVARFEAKQSCAGCGYESEKAAEAAQTAGLPEDARNVTDET
jgi:hypothetical protein